MVKGYGFKIDLVFGLVFYVCRVVYEKFVFVVQFFLIVVSVVIVDVVFDENLGDFCFEIVFLFGVVRVFDGGFVKWYQEF